jgi:hypothetical protein
MSIDEIIVPSCIKEGFSNVLPDPKVSFKSLNPLSPKLASV